ncbi:hypothetical protein SAMN02744787_3841 [Bacillus subtilis]|nr:hypothetical protein CD007_14245 [Bacillus subtilis]ASC81854.1 hypothetical protein CDA59_04890 [Bacillus subtilis]PAC85125.1 hypothetical protein CHI03_13910 [Bacillus subtilis]PAE67335.1 hypothetical protein CHH85_14260 [Bacillus subtilis]PAM77628.1 hypothetical protein CFD21_11840 [Bacillus subtilis]
MEKLAKILLAAAGIFLLIGLIYLFIL